MSFVYATFLWLLVPLFAYLMWGKKERGFVQVLRWWVLALLIVAMARPVMPQEASHEKLLGHSVIIALDLSVSMKANDVKANDISPTRLKASQESIKVFLEHSLHERVALIGFTINPLLLSPPTTDHELVKIALENMNPEYILTKGTDLKKLFEKIAQFKDEHKKVILFSDGGDEVLDESLSGFLQEQQIELFAIGMATQQGSPITQKDGTLLKNEQGNIVVSRLNPALETLAKQSGGAFVSFSSVGQTVESINEWLEEQDKSKEAFEQKRQSYFELSIFPLALAMVLFFLSATRFSKNLLALLLLLGFNLQAEEIITRESWGEGEQKYEQAWLNGGFLDDYYLYRAYGYYEAKAYENSKEMVYKMKEKNLEATLLLAHILYKQENYKAAKSLLQSIKSTNKKIKQQIYYELGNCEAKLTYMRKAKAYYVKALQLGEDEDTMHNLAWVIRYDQEHSSQAGYTNPSSAQAQKSQSDDLETNEEKSTGNKKESSPTTGGTGDNQSKISTVKVVKLEEEGENQRRLSSKAYDLINEGFVNEEKPW